MDEQPTNRFMAPQSNALPGMEDFSLGKQFPQTDDLVTDNWLKNIPELSQSSTPYSQETEVNPGIGQNLGMGIAKQFEGGALPQILQGHPLAGLQHAYKTASEISPVDLALGLVGGPELKAEESLLTPVEEATKGLHPEGNTIELPQIPEKEISLGQKPSYPPSINESNQFVKNEPFNLEIGPTDRKTAVGLREELSGIKNAQIVRGNQLTDQIKKAVPNTLERQGMFWYKAAEGNKSILENAFKDSRLAEYHPQIERALNLSPEAKQALSLVEQYYREGGNVSKELGTIRGVIENYQNRIYKPEPPKDFVKTELKQNLKQTTSHAKQRIFNTEFEAAQAGKKFATTDIADALSIHNEEMARVNTSRKLADAMSQNGIGQFTDINKVPPDWEQVGNVRKGNQILAAPKNIAKGLGAIADPNYISKIDALRGLQKYQGLVKTVDLSYSFFHHRALLIQTLAQHGISDLPGIFNKIDTPEFAKLEQWFVRRTGITTKVSANQDIVRSLIGEDKSLFGKVTNAPVIKQILQGAQANARFLFDNFQRFEKVSDFGERASNWAANHPTATNEEIVAAEKSIAKEVNASFGGLNWEAMGVDKSNQSLLRLVFLAPDWLVSNLAQTKYALPQAIQNKLLRGSVGSAGAWAARGNFFKTILGGVLATEMLNKLTTGHFTGQNPPGHKLEIQIAPNVYTTLFSGASGDLIKFISNVQESGAQGVARFIQGKTSPVYRLGTGLLSGVNYAGRNIYSNNKKNVGPVGKTINAAKFIGQTAGPIPFGLSTLSQYLGEKNKTLGGGIGILSGLGRYSTPPKSYRGSESSGNSGNRFMR